MEPEKAHLNEDDKTALRIVKQALNRPGELSTVAAYYGIAGKLDALLGGVRETNEPFTVSDVRHLKALTENFRRTSEIVAKVLSQQKK